MDFASMLPSSLGLGGEFLTPVGREIEQATSENLVSPNWSLNMQICDEVCCKIPRDPEIFGVATIINSI